MDSAHQAAGLAELSQRLQSRGFAALDETSVDAFVDAPGTALLLFADDPRRGGETWDVAVVLPEALRAVAAPLRAGFLLPEAGRRLQPRYGFTRWPAAVFLRDGAYVGAIEGMRDWSEYQSEVAQMLLRPSSRAPTLGVAISAAAGGSCGE